MLEIDLTMEEQTILADLLETCIADLRSEIQNTDNLTYKDMLKKRRQILAQVLEAVESAGQAVTGP